MSTNCVQCVKRERTGRDLLCDECRRSNEERDLENRFTYHAPKEGQPAKYQIIRGDGLNMAKAINALCPNSRERSLALTKLEEAVMWANAAIARNE